MDHPSLYDDDIVTWAEQQAAALRALGQRADLSNAVDWENVAEEIESVGRSQIHAVESLLAQVLSHLLKQVSAPSARASLHWREEILTFHAAALLRYEKSMRQRIRWDQIWKLAQTMANSSLIAYGDALLPRLPQSCPIPPEEILAQPIDIDAALRRIVDATELH
ncbi:DUF29 domain-containing protein [Methylobacterium oxalidis]|uniref:DUF29 domain-containing protein n=1 Tax=Methylobacterium oxalidis TaxID=944322 RepID=A0A512IWI1_9HYPH|nr:DUF29 domain-containing protein [Methylobacterium oxalidis]GEP02071.1 hypothetical protein MOX02_01090 [Methylobacterium oxalidis]GJE31874.1 hypothetical protein LDDCCGHA_2056 [Methylobacterium oxalidis]GLS62016.1 hypothetical protein GCM10007888_03970 [Methylobacterium oxalidis]